MLSFGDLLLIYFGGMLSFILHIGWQQQKFSVRPSVLVITFMTLLWPLWAFYELGSMLAKRFDRRKDNAKPRR